MADPRVEGVCQMAEPLSFDVFRSTGYVVYGNPLSYFTRKLTAAMDFLDLPCELRAKDAAVAEEVERRSGTHQVPVLHTPENWMIADTTPLIELLDARAPRRALFPAGPLGVLVHLVEEYFDEWIARTMVHYRWHYPQSAEFAARRMTGGNAEAAARIAAWGPRACRATGTEAPSQQQAAEAEYRRLLDAMERQLAETRFLLGDRPTAADCIVLGGLRAHTLMDPDPKAVVSEYPAIVAWAEQDGASWDGEGALAPFPESTPFARLVLDELREHYLPVLEANRRAVAAGARAFQAQTYDEAVSYLTRPYPIRSWTMIERRVAALDGADRQAVLAWAAREGLGSLAA